MGLGAVAATVFSCRLFLTYRNLEVNALESYRANNFTAGGNLNMLVWDTYTESMRVTAADPTQTVNLKVPNVVFASHIYYRDKTATNTGAAFLESGLAGVVLNTVSLTLQGRKIYENIPAKVLEYDAARYKKTSLVLGVEAANVITVGVDSNAKGNCSLYYGIDQSYTSQMGAISFGNVSDASISLTASDDFVENTTITVVHFIWKLLSISSNDGRLVIGNSI